MHTLVNTAVVWGTRHRVSQTALTRRALTLKRSFRCAPIVASTFFTLCLVTGTHQHNGKRAAGVQINERDSTTEPMPCTRMH